MRGGCGRDVMYYDYENNDYDDDDDNNPHSISG